MRPSKRALGLLLGAGILFLIGTNVQAGWLYVLAALLLGALAAGLVLPFAALRGLSIELVAPEEAEQGVPTIIELRVEGPSRGVRRNVTVRDTHLEPVEVVLPPIRRRERIEVTTLRTPRRRGEVLTVQAELRYNARPAARVHHRDTAARGADRDGRAGCARRVAARPRNRLP